MLPNLPNPTQTIEITNFGGRLTRKLNGDLNSGFAKFVPSFGYDPFSKPDNLTWLEQPSSILSSTTDLILAAKQRFNGNVQKIYAVSSAGTLYSIQPSNLPNASPNPNLDTSSVIGLVAAGSPPFNYGASMDFFGVSEKIYIGSDAQINSINFDGSGDAVVGSSGNYHAATFRALRQFLGKLIFNNGNTIGAINANTQTVTSSVIGTGLGSLYSELNPPLGIETRTQDLDVSRDGNYLLITASNITDETVLTIGSDAQVASSTDGAIYKWNGTDATITSLNTVPSYSVTALQTYLNNETFFSNDTFGASLNDGTNKILTLPGNKSPLPNATLANGNFISWINPEITSDGTGVNASMYYFGSLDQENPPGLYRMVRYTPTLSNGFVYQTPLNILTNNKYTGLNNARTATTVFGYGKHYFSVWETSAATQTQYRLFRFLITPTGTGTPQLGVYETQTQLFSKRVTIEEIRVYTEPTAANNGFKVDCIDSDGSVITNGTFNYTYAAGTDPTLLQGAQERVDFIPAMKDVYALGLRITNTGTTNMTIKKIEVDWSYSGS